MTEQIRLLAEQAGYKPLPGFDFANSLQEIFLKKFAELIIRECAETCKENLVNDAEAQAFGLTYNNAVGDCAIQIKQHFGVEE